MLPVSSGLINYRMVCSSRIVAIIQARANSERLPNKVLRPLNGRPMLMHVIDRVKMCPDIDGVCLATSHHVSDDPVAALAAGAGVDVFRGPLDDVLSRLSGAAAYCQADAIVRISGDSPAIDPALISAATVLWRATRPDIVTNVRERTFPKGQSVEVIAAATLRVLAANAGSGDREHVTSAFYRDSDRHSIVDFRTSPAHGDVQMSVDTETDFVTMEAALCRAGAPYEAHGWLDLLAAHRALADEKTTT